MGHCGALDYVGSAADSGAAPCWLRTSSDGRFLYASNTGDQSISVYDVTNPAKPTEIEHLHADGVGGYEQFSLDPSGTSPLRPRAGEQRRQPRPEQQDPRLLGGSLDRPDRRHRPKIRSACRFPPATARSAS